MFKISKLPSNFRKFSTTINPFSPTDTTQFDASPVKQLVYINLQHLLLPMITIFRLHSVCCKVKQHFLVELPISCITSNFVAPLWIRIRVIYIHFHYLFNHPSFFQISLMMASFATVTVWYIGCGRLDYDDNKVKIHIWPNHLCHFPTTNLSYIKSFCQFNVIYNVSITITMICTDLFDPFCFNSVHFVSLWFNLLWQRGKYQWKGRYWQYGR